MEKTVERVEIDVESGEKKRKIHGLLAKLFSGNMAIVLTNELPALASDVRRSLGFSVTSSDIAFFIPGEKHRASAEKEIPSLHSAASTSAY